MSHLPDCAGSKYSLQLNMYRYILKKYYDVHVSEMVLAAFHPDLEGYFATPVPEMDAEISAIVQDIAANSACAPSTSKEKTLYINGS